MENLEVVDAEIVSVIEVSSHGTVEVEEGRKPRIGFLDVTAMLQQHSAPCQLRDSLFERCLSSA